VTSFTLESIPFRLDLERRLRGFRIAAGVIGPMVAFLDFFVLLAAMDMARRLYAGTSSDVTAYSGLGLIAGLTFLLCSRVWSLDRYSRLVAPKTTLIYIAAAVTLGVAAVSVLLFLLKVEAAYSRGVLMSFAVLATLFIVTERFIVAAVLRRAITAEVIRGKRAVIIAEEVELQSLSKGEIFHVGVSEVGRIALPLSEHNEALTDHARSLILQSVNLARRTKASEYALIIPRSYEASLPQIVELLRASPRAIRLYPDQKTRAFLSRKGNNHLDSCFYAEIQPEPLSLADRLAKRLFDLVAASFGLVLLSPMLAIVALLIKIDSPGPIFFRQTRKGFDDHEFRIWKFRTMSVMEDGAIVVQAQRGDRRVTRIGRLLRRTSVDELPQLINVIMGEMSIVGPRPHAVVHDLKYDDIIARYATRRHVKPGLTGMAQVHGLRGETQTHEQMERRLEKDLWYINNWSFWLDVKIALQTFIALAVNEAY
jgi:Undecaprenyl-phosphate glucose phosphotransferase